jgi:hypothetical protein
MASIQPSHGGSALVQGERLHPHGRVELVELGTMVPEAAEGLTGGQAIHRAVALLVGRPPGQRGPLARSEGFEPPTF